jgi:hypothetical protein
VKLIPVPARLAVRASLLVCVLAGASLHAFTPAGGHPSTGAAATTATRSGDAERSYGVAEE